MISGRSATIWAKSFIPPATDFFSDSELQRNNDLVEIGDFMFFRSSPAATAPDHFSVEIHGREIVHRRQAHGATRQALDRSVPGMVVGIPHRHVENVAAHEFDDLADGIGNMRAKRLNQRKLRYRNTKTPDANLKDARVSCDNRCSPLSSTRRSKRGTNSMSFTCIGAPAVRRPHRSATRRYAASLRRTA